MSLKIYSNKERAEQTNENEGKKLPNIFSCAGLTITRAQVTTYGGEEEEVSPGERERKKEKKEKARIIIKVAEII